MRSSLVKASAALTLAIASHAAYAVDGTVTINGTITSMTCTVNVNGGGTTQTLTLPTIGATALNGSNPSGGVTAGSMTFSIGVSNCAAGMTSMAPYFEAAGSSTFNANGRVTTAVSGVDIQILNSANNPVALNVASATVTGGVTAQNVPVVNLTGSAGSRTATSTFTARYYSTAASVGTGNVTAALAYTITYQ